ncbi:MAG: DUF2271 domain-containing protein [Candidatus Krumholzibacteriota bacterium]|nr:DUF2271 domain-containing protein [Candidatus Krumholzibacteriota bacterium]
MKRNYITIMILVLSLVSKIIFAASVDEYIKKAKDLQKSDKLDKALVILDDALVEFPENSTLYAYKGLYTGMKAGRTGNFLEAGELSSESFRLLDKAVSLGPDNHIALMFRGLMSVKVPGFLGKLNGGIEDLQRTCEIIRRSPDKLSIEDKILTWNLLGEGYKKKGDLDKAAAAWEKIIKNAPESSEAESAEARIKKLKISLKNRTEPKKTKTKQPLFETDYSSDKLLKKGEETYRLKDYDRARKIFEKAVEKNPQNAESYMWLGLAISRQAEKGYDERISSDTDLRTALVFESMENFDKAVELAPDDAKLRFIRGSMGIQFPFFANKLEQGIKDLSIVLESDVSDSLKSEAKFLLGTAYQKKGMSYWIDLAVRHPESAAALAVYNSLRPGIKRTDPSKLEKPCMIIDFVLGFRDELAPQTAVWIEDEKGNYVNTVYVSGFSGNVKSTQIVLPSWAESSDFNNIDAVTAASIDIGHHIYTWDLVDFEGNPVSRGYYTVKVEVSHWPSMKYQLAETGINIGGESGRSLSEEGNFIPYLEVRYLKD